MLKRKIAIVVLVILCVAFSYLTINNLTSFIGPKIHPTQTSLYFRHLDLTENSKLRTPQRDGKLSREQAIGLAELDCEYKSLPKQYPTNIEADLVADKEARTRLGDENPDFSTKEVWLVTMNGAWVFTGRPEPQANETRVPAVFQHCGVILDAKTGEFMS